MKRVTKSCFGSHDDVVQQPDLTQSSEETSEPPSVPALEPESASPAELQSKSNSSEQWSFDFLSAKRHNNAFTVTKARFLPDDELHTVVISFDKEGGTNMTLTVDGTTIYQVNTAEKLRGSAVLDIAGLVVDLSWNIARIPLKFAFRTREFSFHARTAGGGSSSRSRSSSRSSSSSSSARSGRHGEQRKEVRHVYLLEILAV